MDPERPAPDEPVKVVSAAGVFGLAAPEPDGQRAAARLAEAEDTLRAIGAGEVDAFVLSDGGEKLRVFTLTTADRPYRMFVENMRDGAATVSRGGVVLYANRCLAELLSLPLERIVGASLAPFVAGGLPPGLWDVQDPHADHKPVEWTLLAADGAPVPALVGTSSLTIDGDEFLCLTFSDLRALQSRDREIAQLNRAQAVQMAQLQDADVALTTQATHDWLTGLPNRALLVDRIEQTLARAGRAGGYMALLFVDVDRFKQVNDIRGHAAGDAVLKRLAAVMLAELRPMDTVARIGGDEFVALIPDIQSRLDAVQLTSRLVDRVSRRSTGDGEGVTVSVGIAFSENGRGSAERLLSEADTAMYKAKRLGGGRAEIFDRQLGLEVEARSKAQVVLQAALGSDRLLAHYQPIVDLATGRVVSFEALARITQADGSMLSPAAFIPVAESSGLVIPLGGHMLQMACLQACGWPPPSAPESPLSVAVNVSARQFEPGNLTDIVREHLQATGLDGSCLHLELTETALMDLHPGILRQLEELRDIGVDVGLDDFGTGYASLTHLRRLPVTFVKIDQSFVSGMVDDRGDDRIVAAVIELAANLGVRSIAEGVETQVQLDRLRKLGCDQAQGYLFARPLPGDALAATMQHAPW